MNVKDIFEKFLELKDFYKYLIFIGIWGIIACLIYFLIINPQYNEIKQKKAHYNSLKRKTNMIVKVKKRLNNFKEQFEKIKNQYNIAIKKLPNTREIPELLLKVSAYGKENNLDFLLFKPKKEVAKEFYAIIPISLKFTGKYIDTGKFFFDIGKTTRIVKVKNFTVSKKGENKIYVNANLETYKFLKNKPQKKKKKKRRK